MTSMTLIWVVTMGLGATALLHMLGTHWSVGRSVAKDRCILTRVWY